MVYVMLTRAMSGLAVSSIQGAHSNKSLVANDRILFSCNCSKQPPKITGCEDVALKSIAFDLDIFARKLRCVIGANTSGVADLVQLSQHAQQVYVAVVRESFHEIILAPADITDMYEVNSIAPSIDQSFQVATQLRETADAICNPIGFARIGGKQPVIVFDAGHDPL